MEKRSTSGKLRRIAAVGALILALAGVIAPVSNGQEQVDPAATTVLAGGGGGNTGN